MHAYIIEDQYLIARALQDMLEDLGFTKFSFARSEDAAILGAHHPSIDLITPVLFITAYREELEERKPGAVILQKPVKPEALAEAVQALVGDRARPAQEIPTPRFVK